MLSIKAYGTMAKPDAVTFDGIARSLVARQRIGLKGDSSLQQQVYPSLRTDADRFFSVDLFEHSQIDIYVW